MVSRNIRITNRARLDLQKLHKYISQFDLETADKYVNGIYNLIHNVIGDFAESGSRLGIRSPNSAEHRFFPYKSHLIIYEIKRMDVFIKTIFISSHDLTKLRV